MVEEDSLALLLKYPLISRNVRGNERHYSGVITCRSLDYNLHIIEKQKGDNVKFKLKSSFGPKIDAQISKIISSNIVAFLDKTTAILDGNLTRTPKNPVHGFRRVLHEYYEFAKFHLNVKSSKISADLSTINIVASDDNGRTHTLEIAVDFKENKDIFIPHNLNFPEQFCKDLQTKWSSLSELYEKFLGVIETLQPFFNVMDDLDQCCYILDPEQPSRRECYRRIWLSENMSVMVTIDPFNVGARPELKFLGPEQLVLQYRHKLNEKLEAWVETSNLLKGLMNILQIDTFPTRIANNVEMLLNAGECSICFSVRFNHKLPEVICSNKSCENFYHVECLYEWLISVNSKRIFNQVHGQCPNCEKGISCPLPDADVT